jgi:hypothetical protein
LEQRTKMEPLFRKDVSTKKKKVPTFLLTRNFIIVLTRRPLTPPTPDVPHPATYSRPIYLRSCLMLSLICAHVPSWSLLLSCFPNKRISHFPHAPPISFYLICSSLQYLVKNANYKAAHNEIPSATSPHVIPLEIQYRPPHPVRKNPHSMHRYRQSFIPI